MVCPVLGPVPGSDAAIRTGAFGFSAPVAISTTCR